MARIFRLSFDIFILSLVKIRMQETCVISGFRCYVDDICVLLGYYAAFSGSSAPTFWDNLSILNSRVNKSKKTLGDMTDRLFRNVGTEIALGVA
jgi:hypothetical protein